MKRLIAFSCLFAIGGHLLANEIYMARAKDGDGVFSLLRRYDLLEHSCNIDHFYDLNDLHQGAHLVAGRKYNLPIYVYPYNGKSIRSTIGDYNWDKAVRIQQYNNALTQAAVKPGNYTSDKILWVPFHELECGGTSPKEPVAVKVKSQVYPIFGPQYENVIVKSDVLRDKVFYIVSGHGGPDTGALGIMGFSNKIKSRIVEDEYAYDVSLRLARLLIENGATVHIIIQDMNDGIRDTQILEKDYDEVCYNGDRIPASQLRRLEQRTKVVNSLFYKHMNENKRDQLMISLHVDSRPISQRIDVYFYHHDNSTRGKAVAQNLQQTFKEKYAIYQKGRTYSGTFQPRNELYVIKNTLPPAVFVELANIQNAEDQKRLLLPENRQYLAEWLYEGLTRDIQSRT